MFRSDVPLRPSGLGRIEPFLHAVKATPTAIPKGLGDQGGCTESSDCIGMLPCVVEVAFPTIPQGLDGQGMLIAQYMNDLARTLLEAMHRQIANLERTILATNSDTQSSSLIRGYDAEVAQEIHVKSVTEILHQAAPSDIETSSKEYSLSHGATGDTSDSGAQFHDRRHASVRSNASLETAQSGTSKHNRSSVIEKFIPRLRKSLSSSTLFESTRRDIETHQVMKIKARIRACFTSNSKPLMLSPATLSSVLQRRGMEAKYDITMLEEVLLTMHEILRIAPHEEKQEKPKLSGAWTLRTIQKNRIAAATSVSKRRRDSCGQSSNSNDGIVDLDMFIRLLLSPDLVSFVQQHTEDHDITRCIIDIQCIFLEKETIDDIIERLASAETSVDWAHTWRNSEWIEFITVLVSLFAYVLEVDDQQDWMGWGVIELASTLVLTLLIVWKVYAESLRTFLCGEMWKWNLTETGCTAVAVIALLARLVTGGLYSVRLIMAIRLLRCFREQSIFLYLVPVMREAAMMLTGVVVGLPYLFWSVFLMMVLTLIAGVAAKLALGPSVGQDFRSQCGTGDSYYRNGDRTDDECLLVYLYSEEFLDSVALSVLTTFRCITGSCTTKAGLSLDLIFIEYYGTGLLIAYIAITCTFLFGIANVLTAVFLDGMHRQLQSRFNHVAPPSNDVHSKLKGLKQLVREIVRVANDDLPVNLTRGELDRIMKDIRVRSILHELDVCFDSGVPAFELFDFDCDEYVRESDFYFMILKMRGYLQKADVVGTWLNLRDQREANHVIHLAMLDAQQNIYRQVQLRNAAVMLYRVDEVFEDEINPNCGERCIVSFPGRHVFEWQGLIKLCKQGLLNSACVYLPKDDPKNRYGRHSKDPSNPSNCYCHALYGAPKEWGCRWFEQWMEQVRSAVSFQMELVVVFFEGQKDCGILDWAHLASADLWDGVGLGGSQKGEVAWLKNQGYAFTSMDLREAVDCLQLNISARRALRVGNDLEGSSVVEIATDYNDWLLQDNEPALALARQRIEQLGRKDLPRTHY